MKCILLFWLLIITEATSYAQTSIEEYYKYLPNSEVEKLIEFGDLRIIYDRDKVFRYKSYLYLLSNSYPLDSLMFEDGYIETHESIDSIDELNIWYREKESSHALAIFIDQNKFKVDSISGLDTLYLFDYLYGFNYFIEKKTYVNVEGDEYEDQGFKLYRKGFDEKHVSLLFNFYELEEIKKYENWSPYIPLVTKIYSIGRNDKILIETGIYDGGLTNLSYFTLDTKSKKVEDITRTANFQKLVADPKANLINYPHYRHLSFEPKIGNEFIVDSSDSLAYFSAGFHESDARWEQDAFVMDHNYKIIGRVLKRKMNIVGHGMNDIERWFRVRSFTDSTSSVDFNLQLKYDIEKAFYYIYYDSLIDKTTLDNMNKHELSLVKNFIFAKHNYQFSSIFYQAYYNTFSFYNSSKSKQYRTKEVSHLLTEADKKNLDLILNKINN